MKNFPTKLFACYLGFSFIILNLIMYSSLSSLWRSLKIIRQFRAEEANQGVAVDEYFFYAIGTKEIGKYDKFTGERVAHWEASNDQPIIHLDSGVIVGNCLYCAHSNYPNLPMVSSIEIWDTNTLEHIGNHSFGISEGSCTWVDRYDRYWWVCFAHYNEKGGYPEKDNRWTVLVKYDDSWRKIESWTFPPEVLSRFAPYSCSGGSWGSDGLLYCTGHDRKELYVLRLPKMGSVLKLVKILPIQTPGQGIAWDRSEENILFSIHRKNKTVVVSRLN